MDSFRSLANWIEEWKKSADFTLTAQTSSASIVTLRAQAISIDELLGEDYISVFTGHLQTYPLERRFSQYRQMNDGRFLASLREVLLAVR